MLDKRPRPRLVHGVTEEMPTNCGGIFVTTNGVRGEELEVFARCVHNDPCKSAMFEGLTRMISLSLRYGVPTEEVIDQLEGISCVQGFQWVDGERITSCVDAISLGIKRFVRSNGNGTVSGYEEEIIERKNRKKL